MPTKKRSIIGPTCINYTVSTIRWKCKLMSECLARKETTTEEGALRDSGSLKYLMRKSIRFTWKLLNQETEKKLENILSEHISPSRDTTAVSDGWAAYQQLENTGFNHKVVIHDTEFVNEDGYPTNSIEIIWSQLKNWINSIHWVSHKHGGII